MQVWVVLLFVLLLTWIILHFAIYFTQDRMIFHAEKLSKTHKFRFNSDFEEINLITDDGNILNGLLFKVIESRGLVIFYHNHSGNLEHCSRFAQFMNSFDHDVLMMDYRGFGKSTGKFKEETFLSDSKLWYDYAVERYTESLITLYGRGIGATFATYVASLNNPKQLILDAPMYNLAYLSRRHYPLMIFEIGLKYRFDTAKYYVNIKCKTFIFHGKKNKLVHYENSLKLYELSQDRSELYIIPNGNHYNLMNNQFYTDKIQEIFLQSI